jgi:hypothetical protein
MGGIVRGGSLFRNPANGLMKENFNDKNLMGR